MSSKTHNTHYGASMSPDQMHDWAKNAAKQIRILQESDPFCRDKRPAFFYSGMSGVAAATALSVMLSSADELNPGMVYVRKPGEKSHGEPVEMRGFAGCDDVRRDFFFVFCDDFISTGDTFVRVVKKVQNRFQMRIGIDSIFLALSGRETVLQLADYSLDLVYKKRIREQLAKSRLTKLKN